MTHYDLTDVVARNSVAQFGSERTPVRVGVHTSESAPLATVRGLANFIGTRTDKGSYGEVADIFGNTATLVPVERRTWGSRKYRSGGLEVDVNATTLHVAFVYAANDWGTKPAEETAMILALAKRVRPQMLRYGIPAVRLMRPVGRGVHAHADSDPARRYDPGPAFPWDLFLNALEGHTMTPEQRTELETSIRQDYLDLAGREADAGGLKYWADAIADGSQPLGLMRELLAREGLKRAHSERAAMLRRIAALAERVDALEANSGQSSGVAFTGGAVVLKGQLTIEDA